MSRGGSRKGSGVGLRGAGVGVGKGRMWGCEEQGWE